MSFTLEYGPTVASAGQARATELQSSGRFKYSCTALNPPIEAPTSRRLRADGPEKPTAFSRAGIASSVRARNRREGRPAPSRPERNQSLQKETARTFG